MRGRLTSPPVRPISYGLEPDSNLVAPVVAGLRVIVTNHQHRTMLARTALALGRFAVEHSAAVLVVLVVLTLAIAPFMLRLRYDDDVIKFLPHGNEQVRIFKDIGRRFHGLSIGVVGVSVEDGDLIRNKRVLHLAKPFAAADLSAAVRSVAGPSQTGR